MSENERENVNASAIEGESKPAETPAERGEALGEQIAALEAEQASEAATPAGKEADRKKHIGVIAAVVAFAVLLIGAGVAYSALAPAADNQGISTTTPAQNADKAEGDTSARDSADDSAGSASQESAPGNNAATETDANKDEQDMSAPDFTMTDASGKTLTLADFRGKPVLLNFWASWCGPCASEMPDIQAAWEEHGDEIEFVIVNMTGMSGETEQSAKEFLSQNGYTFPCYFDVDQSAATAYGVSSIPQSYLIDAEGNILGGYMGAMNATVLNEGIDLLTGAVAPTAP